jgi:hypothetical protein
MNYCLKHQQLYKEFCPYCGLPVDYQSSSLPTKRWMSEDIFPFKIKKLKNLKINNNEQPNLPNN